jgi:hypothetical protein
MPRVHLRSTYWSHAIRRLPARIIGRHANQRCQFMTDGGRLDGISYKNARVERLFLQSMEQGLSRPSEPGRFTALRQATETDMFPAKILCLVI